jgi:hypothetical protein
VLFLYSPTALVNNISMHSAGSSPKEFPPEKKGVEPSADSSEAPCLIRQPSGILSQAELDEISAAELAVSGQQKGQ